VPAARWPPPSFRRSARGVRSEAEMITERGAAHHPRRRASVSPSFHRSAAPHARRATSDGNAKPPLDHPHPTTAAAIPRHILDPTSASTGSPIVGGVMAATRQRHPHLRQPCRAPQAGMRREREQPSASSRASLAPLAASSPISILSTVRSVGISEAWGAVLRTPASHSFHTTHDCPSHWH
jgi:hypothetical protein